MTKYILSIVAAAIICAVARSLMNEKTAMGQIVKLLTGILMTVTIIAPLANITFDHVTNYLDGLSADADAYVVNGKAVAQGEISGIIKSQVQAYILDKASSMGLKIAVEVELDEVNDQIPCGVTVTGAVSPYAKEVLSEYMSDILGIPKENQRWM